MRSSVIWPVSSRPRRLLFRSISPAGWTRLSTTQASTPTSSHSRPRGHSRVFAVNVLAPYLLTALIDRPNRLGYLTSDMQTGGNSTLTDLDWTTRRLSGGTGLAG